MKSRIFSKFLIPVLINLWAVQPSFARGPETKLFELKGSNVLAATIFERIFDLRKIKPLKGAILERADKFCESRAFDQALSWGYKTMPGNQNQEIRYRDRAGKLAVARSYFFTHIKCEYYGDEIREKDAKNIEDQFDNLTSLLKKFQNQSAVCSNAESESGSGTENETTRNTGVRVTSDLSDITKHVQKLMDEEKLQPNEILIVFDVESTLTNGHPAILNGIANEARGPRQDAVKTIYELKNKGVQLLASCDQTNFNNTVFQLQDSGWKDAFGIPDGGTITEDKRMFPDRNADGREIEIEFAQSGNAISASTVSRFGPGKEGKYLQKALAPKIALGDGLKTIKKVIFVDDNLSNINQFHHDRKQFDTGLPNVDYFHLKNS